MGFDAEIDYVEQTRKIPNTVTEEEVDWTSPFTKTITSRSYTNGYSEVTADFPVVKTLTASGAGGGGVSIGNQTGGKANAKKGKSGGSKKKDWKNPYDKHYNTLEQINEALREREKLERRYQRLLEQSGTKGSDLVKNAEQQIAKAEEEVRIREKLRSARAE
jgi:hypothetical protein